MHMQRVRRGGGVRGSYWQIKLSKVPHKPQAQVHPKLKATQYLGFRKMHVMANVFHYGQAGH